MKLIGLIRSTETREIHGEGVTYTEARKDVERKLSEGWVVKEYLEEN